MRAPEINHDESPATKCCVRREISLLQPGEESEVLRDEILSPIRKLALSASVLRRSHLLLHNHPGHASSLLG